MAAITDVPPPHVVTELDGLRDALDGAVPARRLDDNVLIGTWNIRAFGDLTEQWDAAADQSPKRDLRALRAITAIVGRFDVVALQEVRGNIKALRHMLKALGSEWGLILTDVTRGAAGNDERMAFVFDTRRVKPSGLACELVVPDEWLARGVGEQSLRRQFARTPYAVSFLCGGVTFILVTLHVIYGEHASDRVGELKAIAEWMASWAKTERDWNHNLIVLGDFNIDRQGDPNYQAFTSTGLSVPEELNRLPRTIFDKDEKHHHYDQIAWFTEGDSKLLSLAYEGSAGNFDFRGVVFPDLPMQDLSWRVSDHFPLWTEFLTR